MSVPSHAIALLRPAAAPLSVPATRPLSQGPDARWDLLLLCVAGYVLSVVGRVHQLFPSLDAVRPALLTGFLAIALYLFDRQDVRGLKDVFVPTTKYLMAFSFWMMLSVTTALVRSNSFELVFGNFIKTVLMYLVIAAAVRGIRDVERLLLAYLLSAVAYAAVTIARFDVGTGADWRLGRLYYYDANDLATFLVTAMPFGLYFLHAARRASARVLAAVGLAVLTVAFVRTGSRGGFIALLAVVLFVVFRSSAIRLRWRVGAAVIVVMVVIGTASGQYWEQMGTIMSDADYNRTDESGRM